MKNLFVAASVAAGLAAGAVPALAQPTTTGQPGWRRIANNEAAGSVQAQNDSPSPYYSQSQPAIGNGAHVGDGSRPDYLLHQHELQNMPGYSPTAGD